MRTVQDIYTAFHIMPMLQLHQLRVGSVGQYVASRVTRLIHYNDVMLACLFHDMGNIIKFDLSVFEEASEGEGREYWEKMKAEAIGKYGTFSHDANVAIAREIGLAEHVADLIDGVSFSKMEKIVASNDLEQKICQYADTRVGPFGVLPLEQRLREARARYLAGKTDREYYTEEGFERLLHAARELESQVCAASGIKPADINDASIASQMESIAKFQVP